MGLDMYLYSVNRTNHTISELEEIDNETITPESPEAEPFLPLRKYEYLDGMYTIFYEVVYWRKFNALHNWFVQKLQGGVDECQMSEINKDTLIELLGDIQSVLDGVEVGELEPISGFFFGSTDKDEWYLERMNDAKTIIENLSKGFDFDNKRLFYRASW